MKLISMTSFVLEQFNLLYTAKIYQDDYVTRTKKYASFIKQPLKLEMFFPCDEDGNVLEEPQFKDTLNSDAHFLATEKYQQAKEKVFFEGFKLNENRTHAISQTIAVNFLGFENWLRYNGLKTIEDLTKYDLTLTPNAIK